LAARFEQAKLEQINNAYYAHYPSISARVCGWCGSLYAVFTRGATNGEECKVESTSAALIHTTHGDGLSANQRFLATFGRAKQDAVIVQQVAEFLDAFKPDIIHVQHMMGLPIRCFELIAAVGFLVGLRQRPTADEL